MYDTNLKKFYIAGSFRYVSLINELSARLERLGFTRTYDWTKNGKADSFEKLSKIANKEYEGIMNCDFLIFLFPGGKGANVEFGIATALKKKIYLLDLTNEIQDFEKTSTFYYLDNVYRFAGNVDDFPKFIEVQEVKVD
ncbi:nucleoside 2-deoxyribosyltransferase [Liquorilactobacillus hordei]|uniref:nucleoside 2-deoxyribosyltransferase n=1 Tax=Liquorilactobacillus hordei TaxID=468911 RepID=UPI0039EAA216